MKILLYLPTPGSLTGAPRRLLTLATALRSHGLYACIASDKDTEVLAKARELGFETLSVAPVGVLKLRGGALFGGGVWFRLGTGLAVLIQNLRFWRMVWRNNVDVVWIRASKGIAFAGLGALFSRRPLVWDVDYELPSKGVVRWLHRFGLWSADAVVYQYAAAAEGIFGKGLADRYAHKFHTIIPGIDLEAVRPFRESRRERVKSVDEPFVVLQVGTVCERKNQLLLIEALGRLDITQLPRKICVRFAGGLSDAPYVQRVERSIAEKGLSAYVELLGWRGDVHSLMAEADLLVMPSKDEGVPNTIQEAMAIGLPVVVSDAGGMPEIVEDGRTGWVLPLDEPSKWAERLQRSIAFQDERDRVASTACAYATEHFGTREWGRQYAAIVRQVAGGDGVTNKESV